MSRSTLPSALISSAALAFAALGCAPRELPINLGLTVSEGIRVDFGPRVKEYALVVDSSGAVWVFAAKWSGAIECRRLLGRKLTEIQAVHGGGRGEVMGLSAAVYGGRQPIVVWCTEKKADLPFHRPVWWARWDGKQWRDEGAVPGAVASTSLSCGTGGDGSIYLVYAWRLLPEESYRVGPDAYFPVKPHYAVFDGAGWHEPRPIGGRSRWNYLGPLQLKPAPRGALHLVTAPRSSTLLDYTPRVVEHRVLQAGKWSEPERISHFGFLVEAVDPTLAVDAQGNLHLVYDVLDRTGRAAVAPSRWRTKRAGAWLGPKAVGEDGYDAVIANDARGRVYCCWKEGRSLQVGVPRETFLQVWGADGRSGRVAVSIRSDLRARLVPGHDGKMYVAWRAGVGGDSVIVQRMSVDGMDSKESQAADAQREGG